MNSITIDDTQVNEIDKETFKLLYDFQEFIYLAQTYIEKKHSVSARFGDLYKILKSASYDLVGYYYHDFNQDWPQVSVKAYIDNDIYFDHIDNPDELTGQLESIFEKINPIHIGLHIKLFPISLYNGTNKSWRTEPQYKIGDSSQIVDQESIEKIWGQSSSLHVFISHKDSIKDRANKLKERLSSFGISAFVAHEDIEPTEEWREVIEKALFSSDALIALLTINFPESDWTDQEVGIAFGQQLPVYPIKMEKSADPYGFIGKIQGFTLKDNIIEKLVEKFLADERTKHPAITSLIFSISSSSDISLNTTILKLLTQTDPRLWTHVQQKTFRELVKTNPKLEQITSYNQINTKLHDITDTPPQSTDLNDEIPF